MEEDNHDDVGIVNPDVEDDDESDDDYYRGDDPVVVADEEESSPPQGIIDNNITTEELPATLNSDDFSPAVTVDDNILPVDDDVIADSQTESIVNEIRSQNRYNLKPRSQRQLEHRENLVTVKL